MCNHLASAGSNADDRHPSNKRVSLTFTQEGQSVHSRHHQVQEDHCGRPFARTSETLCASAGGPHIEPRGFEKGAFKLPHICLVLNHQNGMHEPGSIAAGRRPLGSIFPAELRSFARVVANPVVTRASPEWSSRLPLVLPT